MEMPNDEVLVLSLLYPGTMEMNEISSLQPLERPQSIRELVEHAIKDYIIFNGLRPGQQIPSEGEFAEQLGVSRNSIREAVKSLESQDILKARRGKGLFVKAFGLDPELKNLSYRLLVSADKQALAEILQIRQALEINLIKDAIQLINDEQLNELQQIMDRMHEQAEQGKPFPDEDRAFHNALFEPLGNKTLLTLLDLFWVTFHKAAEITNLEDTAPKTTYQQHVCILEAVLSRDVQEVANRIGDHYAGLERRLAQES